jgi:hypothetical protein
VESSLFLYPTPLSLTATFTSLGLLANRNQGRKGKEKGEESKWRGVAITVCSVLQNTLSRDRNPEYVNRELRDPRRFPPPPPFFFVAVFSRERLLHDMEIHECLKNFFK